MKAKIKTVLNADSSDSDEFEEDGPRLIHVYTRRSFTS